jgi:uncharacterized protein (TIGR02217 family)
MSLYPVEISLAPGFGWQSAPEFNTLIRTLQSGRERRNGQVAQVRHRYTLPYTNITSTAYLNTIKAAFLSVRGQLHAFLVKDPTDFQATLDPLGLAPAGSTPVQLVRTATFGAASYTRTITRPVAGTVTVYQNGIPKAGTLDDTTGLFTPTTAWTTSAVLTWTGEFRVPVRFASDSLPMSIDDRFGAGGAYAMNGSIELVEVFGE